VKKYTKSAPLSHPVSGLPLFDGRPVIVRPAITPGGQYVMRRYRVAPHIADVIADLAGIGCNREVA
jgi:hypothetical protein